MSANDISKALEPFTVTGAAGRPRVVRIGAVVGLIVMLLLGLIWAFSMSLFSNINLLTESTDAIEPLPPAALKCSFMLLTVSLILAFSGRLTMKLTVEPLPLLILKSSCLLPAVIAGIIGLSKLENITVPCILASSLGLGCIPART